MRESIEVENCCHEKVDRGYARQILERKKSIGTLHLIFKDSFAAFP